MNTLIKQFALSSLFLSMTTLSTLSFAGGEKADQHEHSALESQQTKHDNEQEIEEGTALTSAQLSLANIKIEALQPKVIDYTIYAPAEIKANDYTSYLVSPRVDSIVLKRHVALGDHVEKDQPLVTLFSESVAQAQASFQVAQAEWQRVQKLGRKTVGDKRYIEAKTDFQADLGRLLAFGLSKQAIKKLKLDSTNLGQYTLNAKADGAVLSDNFRQGQRLNAGDTLIELANEHTLWVEARLAPTMQLELPVGSKAEVVVANKTYQASVIQKAHTIDPQTRTRTVRLLVDNDDHQLHSGLFADVYFLFSSKKAVLAVPETALMRSSDGDWQVFVETEGKFQGVEVELGQQFGSHSQKWREIKGIASGTKVVTQGAFYVAAEIAKSGFDVHNH